MGSTGRRLPQGMENGLRAPRRQAEEKTGGPKVWRQKIRSFGPGLRPGKGRSPRRARTSIQERKRLGGRVENGEVKSPKKLDEQRRKLQKELREPQEQLATAATRWSKGGTPESAETIAKDTKHTGQKKFTERQYRSRSGYGSSKRSSSKKRSVCRTLEFAVRKRKKGQ